MSLFVNSILIGVFISNFYVQVKCGSSVIMPIEAFSTTLTKAVGAVISNFFVGETSVISVTRGTSTYAYELEQSDIINEILQSTDSQISFRLVAVNVTRQILFNGINKRKFNIIFMDNYNSFRKLFTAKTITNYDVTGHYLLAITSRIKKEPIDVIEKIFKSAWESYIININVLLSNPDSADSALLYTYFPYTNQKCGDTTPVLSNTFQGTKCINEEQLFPSKIRNLHKCAILVATYNTPPYIQIDQVKSGGYRLSGFESDVLETLAKRLNFHLDIHIPKDKWGEIYPNGTMTGAVKMLVDNEANLTIGSCGITQTRLDVMDATISYFQSDLILVIPPGEPYSSFEKLILPFDPLVWMMILLQFVLSVSVFIALKFVSKSVKNFVIGQKNSLPLLSIVSVFLGGPMCYIPGRNFARTLAMIWMLSCLVIRSSYQGSLFNFLQIQKNFSTADTIEKMIERDFKFYVGPSGKNYFDSIPNVRERVVTYNVEYREYYWARVRNSDFKGALLSTLDHVAYENYKNQQAHLHIGKEKIMLFPVVMFVRKGSYLTGQINNELSRYMAAGLLRFWKQSGIDGRFLKPKPKMREPIKMNYQHIEGGCGVCLTLLAVSFLFLYWKYFRNGYVRSEIFWVSSHSKTKIFSPLSIFVYTRIFK